MRYTSKTRCSKITFFGANTFLLSIKIYYISLKKALYVFKICFSGILIIGNSDLISSEAIIPLHLKP